VPASPFVVDARRSQSNSVRLFRAEGYLATAILTDVLSVLVTEAGLEMYECLDCVGLCLHVSFMYRPLSLSTFHSQSHPLFGPDAFFHGSRSMAIILATAIHDFLPQAGMLLSLVPDALDLPPHVSSMSTH
jgi:hypothetical protein